MTHTSFTAEQLAHAAQADVQQSEVLRYWVLIARDPQCDHSNLSRVFTLGSGSYRACRNCGARLDYSLDEGSTQRRACAGAHRPAPGCAVQNFHS